MSDQLRTKTSFAHVSIAIKLHKTTGILTINSLDKLRGQIRFFNAKNLHVTESMTQHTDDSHFMTPLI